MKFGKTWMTQTIADKERNICDNASGGRWSQVEVIETMRFTCYANRLSLYVDPAR